MKARLCKWHKCGCAFTPTDPKQEYCSLECRTKRSVWVKTRGGPVANLMLDSRTFPEKELREMWKKLRAELT